MTDTFLNASTQQNFDFNYAMDQRDTAISLIAEKADRVNPGWNENAYSFLLGFARENKHFLAEDVRIAHVKSGGIPPHDNRAWGAVFNMAVRRGLIAKNGYAPARTGHCRPMPVWKGML